jgi:phosphatidylcholine synthase
MMKPDFRCVAAAAVHCYTATGCTAAVFALVTAAECDFAAAFLCLLVATIIDYTDGSLARAIGTARALPQIDGAAIDNLTDFVANIVAPVFLLMQADLWPKPGPVWLAAVIVPSLYRFTIHNPHRGAGFFLGIPPIFTFPAFYIYELRLPPAVVIAIITLYCILCFVPLKYVHVTRLRRNVIRHGAALLAWWAMYLIVTQGWTPHRRTLTVVSLLYFVYYGVISLHHYRLYVRSPAAQADGAAPSNNEERKV